MTSEDVIHSFFLPVMRVKAVSDKAAEPVFWVSGGPGHDNIQGGDDHDQAVVKTPGPECVAGNLPQRAVCVVPPQQPVVLRCIAITIRVGFR